MHGSLKSILGPIVFGVRYACRTKKPRANVDKKERFKQKKRVCRPAREVQERWVFARPCRICSQTKDKKDRYNFIPEMRTSI